MDNLTFKVPDDNGVLTEYKILKVLNDAEKKISYLIFTLDGEEILASRYKIVNNELVLEAIEDEDEWKFIEDNSQEVLNG